VDFADLQDVLPSGSVSSLESPEPKPPANSDPNNTPHSGQASHHTRKAKRSTNDDNIDSPQTKYRKIPSAPKTDSGSESDKKQGSSSKRVKAEKDSTHSSPSKAPKRTKDKNVVKTNSPSGPRKKDYTKSK